MRRISRPNPLKLFLLAAPLLLAACGFGPVYGDHTGGQEDSRSAFQSISIANIPERSGQILRNDLIDLLYTHGTPQNPEYELIITPIQEYETDLDIDVNEEATRAELRLTTSMTLKDRTTQKVLLQRDLLSVASYNILSSQFTTLVSQQSVRESALNDLAQQTETQLALYFARTH